MSNSISTAFVSQFKGNVDILSQQKGSKLRPWLRIEDIVGKDAFIDQINKTAAASGLSRHANTPLMNTQHTRRKITLTSYDWADLIDEHDKVRLLIDPKNPYSQNAAMAMGRAQDDAAITAALGTAYTGSDGTSAVGLPAGQTLSDTTSAGLTLARLLNAKYMLDNNDVDPEGRVIVISPYQLQQLLNTTQVTSQDYVTVRALTMGQVDTFLGFKFITTTRLNTTGSFRKCFCYQKDALALGIGMDTRAHIAERVDKRHSMQVYYSMDIGASRLEEVSVVEIRCYDPNI